MPSVTRIKTNLHSFVAAIFNHIPQSKLIIRNERKKVYLVNSGEGDTKNMKIDLATIKSSIKLLLTFTNFQNVLIMTAVVT